MHLRRLTFSLVLLGLLTIPVWGTTGHVFVTGHDPDYHALGSVGAQHIIQQAINYADGGVLGSILLVTDQRNPGGDEIDSRLGMTAAGFTFDVADNTGTNGFLNLNTVDFSNYSVIVVASDYGGWLRQDELDILDARKGDLATYLANGGGLVAFAEGGDRAVPPGNYAGTTSGQYGFLPALVSSSAKNQAEVGNTITPFGTSIGLTVNDINGNASHSIFLNTAGLNVVDYDASGAILSLAGPYSPRLSQTPEPSSLLLVGAGIVGVLKNRMRKKA